MPSSRTTPASGPFLRSRARALATLLLTITSLTGCDATREPPAAKSVAVPEETAKKPRLSEQNIAAIRRAIEASGGSLRCSDDGQPVEIDLAVGRGSADPAAIEAALACPGLTALRIRAGALPPDAVEKITSLAALEELMLQDAPLGDDSLEEMAARLAALRRLTLRNVPGATDRGVAALAGLSRLTHLALVDMTTTGKVLKPIAAMPSLVSLDLRMCGGLRGDDLAALGGAPKLAELKLGGYGIDDATMAIVAALPRLESLTVEDAAIGSPGIAKLSESPAAERITSLSFARCSGLDDDALAGLAAFANLRRLSLRDVPVTGGFLAKLPSRDRLESLALNQTFLGDEAFEAIAACRGLKRLELAQTFLSSEAVKKISGLPDLEYLNLAQCGLNDAALEPLAALKKLKTLVVDGNPGVSPDAVRKILGQ
ncbi:MAG: hypothetical protein NTW96_01045 [Planctomycetia bacterium]|nr:hypothetical protein [Planctomycetia bacterium]